MRFNKTTRILHYCMVISVLYQLLSSIWMAVPEPGKLVGYEAVLFSWHIMFFGWGAFLISAVYAMTRFSEPNEWIRLIPWFSKKGRSAFVTSAAKELPDVMRGQLAAPESKGALAGAMHGLGFTLLISLGLTGAYVMNGVRSDGSMTMDMNFMLELHSIFGVLIWSFLACHIFMVLYHLLLGHRKVLDIFARIGIRWK
ncbi:MAG: cytochrome b/b6 domain-containing protein [Mariprofundaceae bacterium]